MIKSLPKSILFVFLFCSVLVHAQKVIDVSTIDENTALQASDVAIFIDSSNALSIEDIHQQNFVVPSQVPVIESGDVTYWVKFIVRGNPEKNVNWVLESYEVHADVFEFYRAEENGKYSVVKTGDQYAFSAREYNHFNFVFDFNTKYKGERAFYVKVRDPWALTLLFNLRSTRYFTSYATTEYLLLGVFYGLLLFVLLHNLMIFVNTKERLYLYYVIFVLSCMLTCALQDGLAFQYMWPAHPDLDTFVDNIVRITLLVAFCLYTFQFFDLKRNDNKMRKYIAVSLLSFLPIYIVKEFVFSDAVYSVFYLIPFVLIYIAAIRAARRKFKPANTFLVGYSLFLLSMFISILKDLGLIQIDTNQRLLEILFVYVIYIGIVFENLFFSFGLAQRIRFLKAENEKLDLSNTKLKFFNLEAEYKLLKNQVSPHFIFNTFETIKYLSKHESEKVESFINNLSEFMRTSLKNDKGVVSLEEEMGLLKNYIYLQQVRFAEALHIEIDSFDNHKYKKVPYFSVITLVENAIKHNVLTVEKPLKIGIHFDKEYLKVCNTLQRKKVVENSTKIGLQNLNERYQLLGASAILVEESETEFCVKIKMIEP